MLALYVPQCRLYSKLPVQCGQRLVTWCGFIFECGRVDDLPISQRHMHKPAHTIEHLSGEANERHYGAHSGMQQVGFVHALRSTGQSYY